MKLTVAIFAAVALGGTLLHAEITDSSANGFTVRGSLNVKAAPADVYSKFMHNVGDWWNPDHTFSHNPHNLSIEEKAGGCFCEKMPDGGGVRHLEIVNFSPGKQVVLTGALGPLQSIAATGSMTVRFAPADGGTKLEVLYTVTGYLPAGMNTWAGPVEGVLKEQFERLKNYVEQGNPAPKK